MQISLLNSVFSLKWQSNILDFPNIRIQHLSTEAYETQAQGGRKAHISY